MATVQPSAGEFKTGLCSCCSSPTDCLCGYFCGPCYAFCTARASDEGIVSSVLHALCYPLCLPCLRSSVREKRGIEGNCCNDVLLTLFCPCCAYIQVKREFDE